MSILSPTVEGRVQKLQEALQAIVRLKLESISLDSLQWKGEVRVSYSRPESVFVCELTCMQVDQPSYRFHTRYVLRDDDDLIGCASKTARDMGMSIDNWFQAWLQMRLEP